MASCSFSWEILPTTHFSAIARMPPSLPQRGRQPKWASPPLDPNFDLFFRCVFTAMLHGARVDRPRAPVAPSLTNTVPYRFSTEAKKRGLFKTHIHLRADRTQTARWGAYFPRTPIVFKVPDTKMRGEEVPQFGFGRKIPCHPDPGI